MRRLTRSHSRMLVVIAAALILGGGTAALATTLLLGNGSQPITAAGVSALSKLPPVSNPPARLLDQIELSTTQLGGDVVRARKTLRLLGSDLGSAHSYLYAYHIGRTTHSDGRDVLCLVLWDRGSDCQLGGGSPFPDVLLVTSPGGPGYVGLPDNTPTAIAGLVADDVTSVSLIENNEQQPLPIANNSFYVELHESPQTAFTVTLRFTYKDGSSKEWVYNQPGPIHLTPTVSH